MAFDESLADRIRDALARTKNVGEKKMFGCICFLLNGNILVGVWKDSLVACVGPDAYEDARLEPHVEEFDMTSRAMKGRVEVGPEGVQDDEQLTAWPTRSR